MAGVSGPLHRGRVGARSRFLLGLAAGGVLSSLFVALTAWLLGTLVQAVVPPAARLLLLALACLAFGLADLTDRTPQVWRQVPASLVHRLPPGTLGAVWGADLGLLFTTKKTVSLI